MLIPCFVGFGKSEDWKIRKERSGEEHQKYIYSMKDVGREEGYSVVDKLALLDVLNAMTCTEEKNPEQP